MKRLFLVLLCAAVALPALFLGSRTGLRLWWLHKLTRIPEAKQRLQIVPTHRTYTGLSSTGQAVDLGYAHFSLPATNPMTVVSSGDGTCVIVSNAAFSIGFLDPFSAQSYQKEIASDLRALEAEKGKNLQRAKEAALFVQDPIRAEIECEEAQLPSLRQILAMGREQFSILCLKLTQKAGIGWGRNGTFSFTSDRIRGLVYVGDSRSDCSRAMVSLASVRGDRFVVGHVWLPAGSPVRINEVLDPLLRSFEFTVDTIPDRPALAALIAKAGIAPRVSQSNESAIVPNAPAVFAPAGGPDDAGGPVAGAANFVVFIPTIRGDGNAVLEKMRTIIIPEVEFRQAYIGDVMEFLTEASAWHDKGASPKGIRPVLGLAPGSLPPVRDEGGPMAQSLQPADVVPRISLNASNISLFELLNRICHLAGLRWEISDHAPKTVPRR